MWNTRPIPALALLFALTPAGPALAGEPALAMAPDDPAIQWGPCPGFFPDTCRIGVLHGAPAEPNADIFFKVPANTELVRHTHTSPERMILVSGEMTVNYDGQEPATLRPGHYAFGPAERPHSARCEDAGECILFIAFVDPIDAFERPRPASE